MNKLKNISKDSVTKKMLCTCLCFFIATVAFADSSAGRSALSSAAADIKAYVSVVKNIVYAIAAVVAVIGSVTIYMKMNNGEQDVKKTIMLIIGSCIALVSLATALPSFFG